jgi:glycosyltransferase involved in cell wall biosynthesis
VSALGRVWRLLPRDLRRDALFGTMAALAPRPDAEPPPPDAALPVTVAGYFGASTGLGAAARRLAAALRLAGLGVAEADLTGPLRQGPAGAAPPDVAPGPGTLLVHVNGPMLPWAMRVLGRRAVAGKRVVAVWNWELPRLAPDWRRGFRFAHEAWVPSRFTADAVSAEPRAPPVRVVPYMVPEPDPSPLGRADFGLPADAFVALSVFDASSSIARKNPLAAVAAHRLAFGDRPDRVLVLKTYNTATAGPAWREVAEAAAAASNIRVLDRALDRRDLWALVRAADCFLSTHRAEGFGFGIAEAMRAARPVLATGWSGNMDFMAGEGAVALPYDLVPARDPQRTYDLPGAVWAEVRVPEAAAALAALAETGPERRIALGRAARATAAALVPETVAARAKAALSDPIRAGAAGRVGLQHAGNSV